MIAGRSDKTIAVVRYPGPDAVYDRDGRFLYLSVVVGTDDDPKSLSSPPNIQALDQADKGSLPPP
jgi:hypothetical protein